MKLCNWPINDLPGLQEPELSLLLTMGIDTTSKLLNQASDRENQVKLAARLGTKAQVINKLVALADLARLPSVGCQYNGLLLHAGAISTLQLATMQPDKLHHKILRLYVSLLQRRDLCPDLAIVKNWIAEAQQLS
jgi:hypothetical protein